MRVTYKIGEKGLPVFFTYHRDAKPFHCPPQSVTQVMTLKQVAALLRLWGVLHVNAAAPTRWLDAYDLAQVAVEKGKTLC